MTTIKQSETRNENGQPVLELVVDNDGNYTVIRNSDSCSWREVTTSSLALAELVFSQGKIHQNSDGSSDWDKFPDAAVN